MGEEQQQLHQHHHQQQQQKHRREGRALRLLRRPREVRPCQDQLLVRPQEQVRREDERSPNARKVTRAREGASQHALMGITGTTKETQGMNKFEGDDQSWVCTTVAATRHTTTWQQVAHRRVPLRQLPPSRSTWPRSTGASRRTGTSRSATRAEAPSRTAAGKRSSASAPPREDSLQGACEKKCAMSRGLC